MVAEILEFPDSDHVSESLSPIGLSSIWSLKTELIKRNFI
jgi:hypothetical protein